MGTNSTQLYAYSYANSLSNDNQAYTNELAYANSSKSLSTKALGGTVGGSSNAELAQWYEEASAYYHAVLAGTEPRPDPASWDEFLTWMGWASQELGLGGNWGESTQLAEYASGDPSVEPDPFGALPGAMGTYVHTEEDAHFGFTGNATRDVWSNNVEIDIAPLSATVTAEQTLDTRSQPPEDVIKITVTDAATGTEAVYFIHDYADANIKINVPEASQVTDHTGGLVEVGKFRKNGGAASNEVDVPFEEQENGDVLVEVPYGDTIQFKPEGGEDQTWDVYGHFNLSVKPSDVVTVTQNPEGGYLILVEHRDGTNDTFKIHEGFHGNINGYPENIHWGDPNSGGVGEEIPSEFRADFTLNSTGETASENPSTPADETHDNEAIYNTQQDVEIYTEYDDAVNTHRITAPGEVILHGASYADTVVVTQNPNGVHKIVVRRNGSQAPEDTETYYVDGASKITLDFLPEKITGNAANDPIIFKGIGEYADQATSADDMAVAEQLANLQGIDATAEQIYQQAANVEPPIDLTNPHNPPNGPIFQFLVEIDPVMANLLQGYQDSTQEQREVLYTQIRDRLVALLQVLYPNAGVSSVPGEGANRDNIMFAGQEVDIIAQPEDVSDFELWEILKF